MVRALASSVNTRDHLAVFYDIVNDRLAGIDLSLLLINLIDTAPVQALPFLAEQYNITGFRGWAFVETDGQKRDLLKNAIKLSAKSGTPWSIKEALRIAGFPYVRFQEGISRYLDGSWLLDGGNTLGSEGWARFKVFIGVDDPIDIPASTTALIRAIVEEYKPARCRLEEIVYEFKPPELLVTADRDDISVDSTVFTVDQTLNL